MYISVRMYQKSYIKIHVYLQMHIILQSVATFFLSKNEKKPF